MDSLLSFRARRSTFAFLTITASLFVGACSCDSSRATSGDAAIDTSVADSAMSDGSSGDSGTDSGTGGGNPCIGLADGTGCPLGSGGGGLCMTMLCVPCVDPTDDGACVAAYGAGTKCITGQCIPAECRTDANCAAAGKPGQICGLTAANQCAPCTGDSQCQAAPGYGAATICSIGSGTCISSACGSAGTPATTTTVNSACAAANPADFCCSGGIATTCVAGNCCSMADCSGGASCIGHTCTMCTAAVNNTYYVDPVNGTDTGSTGSTTCPFRSLTRAMQFLSATFGNAIPAGTLVLLRNDSLRSNATRGETFPISVPANVTVRSELPASRKKVEIGVGSTGFNLAAAISSIQSLTIDGVDDGRNGIAVSGTSSNTTTTLSDLTVTNMANDGITVSAGGVAIGAGVRVEQNGQNPGAIGTGDGLHITGGNASITVQVGGARTGFDQNSGSGIHVTGGSVTLRGFPDVTGYSGAMQNPPAVANGTGTVTANENEGPNLLIVQSGNAKPINSVRGLVAWGSNSDGMQLAAGSNVGIRDCVVVNNARSGVRIVVASPGAAITAAGATINLGPDNLGHNIFQTPTNGNLDAGICVDGNFFNTMQSLSAKANYFNSHDCAAPASGVVVTSSLNGCAGGIDVGIERTPVANLQQTNIRVLLDFCGSL